MGSCFVPNDVYPKSRLLRFPRGFSGKGGPLTPTFSLISMSVDGVVIGYAEYPRPFYPEKEKVIPFPSWVPEIL
jgi:hypothetical protein